MDLIENKISNSSNRHPWELARYNVFLDLISPYINLNQKLTILDIGCGDCYFIGRLSEEFPNLNCIGIDINFTDEQIESFKTIYPKINLYKSLSDIYSIESRVDLVLLMDVIEHIQDDNLFIQEELNQVTFKYNPLIFITVPAFQSLFSHHDVLLEHYRRYNLSNLSNTLTSHNYNIINSGYFFSSLIVLRILELIKEKLNFNKADKGIAGWNQSPFITKLVTNILYLDYKITGIFNRVIKVPGLTTYAISKKNY